MDIDHAAGSAGGAVQQAEKARGGAMGRVLGDPAFRLLWAGQATSYIGDQFSLIALP
jgi:hypothetical protein